MTPAVDVRFVGAVDVGGTNVRLAVVDSEGEIRSRREHPIDQHDPEAITRRIGAELAELAAATAGVRGIDAIGLSFPGLVDTARGRVITGNPAAEMKWDHVPEVLSAALGVPAVVENDGNAAAVGEGWLGGARGVSDYVFIAYGTAFGAGLVIDGRLHRGRRFSAGEISMFPMIRADLAAGTWDLCLAEIAGGVDAALRAPEILGAGMTAADLFAAARAGDAAAAAWVRQAQEYVAMAVAYVALLDPDSIVFGGGVAFAQGEWLLEPIRQLSARFMPGRPDIRLSTLGPNAQLLGAARLAFDAITSPAP